MRSSKRTRTADGGFTLVEVLVALAIVAVALGAAVRASGVIAGTDAGLRMRTMAIAAAENRLVELRLAREFPNPGRVDVDCTHGGYAMRCEQVFRSSVNAGLREVTVRVREAGDGGAVLASVGGLLTRLPRGRRDLGARRPERRRRARDAGKPQAARGARKDAGFTLIELLVAITLMAVLSLIAWRGLDGIVNLRERLAHDADETDQLVRMLGQLERDLAMRAPDTVLQARVVPTLPGAVTDVEDDQEAPPPGPPAATPARPLPLAIGIQPARGPAGSARLEIIREAPAQPGAWQRVAWWRDDDGILYRAAGVPSVRYPLPAPQDGVPVMDAVASFTVLGWLDLSGWQTLPLPPGTTAPVTGLDVNVVRAAPAREANYRRVVSFR